MKKYVVPKHVRNEPTTPNITAILNRRKAAYHYAVVVLSCSVVQNRLRIDCKSVTNHPNASFLNFVTCISTTLLILLVIAESATAL